MSVVARSEYTVSPLADGATGRGVSSVVSQYAVSTSKTTAPSNASFSTNRPTWEPGKYVWTRSLITYTSGSPATSTTTPVVSSEWEAVNEIQVGGRNLVTDSHFYGGVVNGWSASYGTQIVENHILKKTFTQLNSAARIERKFTNLETGTYTLTVYAKTPWDINWKTWVGASVALIQTADPLNFKAYSVTFNVETAGDVTARGYVSNIPIGSVVEIDWFKLEKGNKATDWTPAPEDVDAKIDEVSQDVSETNEAIDQIISANATKQAEIDTQINNLNLALSSLSTGVGENNTSTQGAIDAIQAMIAELEAQKSALSDKIASLEQAKIKTDNYIQIGTVKLSNGATVFGVAVGKDVNVLNPDGTISTFERGMSVQTATAYKILTGGEEVFDVDATGANAKSFRGESVVIDGAWVQTTTPTKGFVMKWGG